MAARLASERLAHQRQESGEEPRLVGTTRPIKNETRNRVALAEGAHRRLTQRTGRPTGHGHDPGHPAPRRRSRFHPHLSGGIGQGNSGGWGVVIRSGETLEEFSGFVPETTANRLHLRAVAEGLCRAPAGRPIRIYTAAEYLHRGATEWVKGWQHNNWRTKEGQPVKNKDAWQELVAASAGAEVHWHFVKGYAPPELARAGELAGEAANYKGQDRDRMRQSDS